MEPLAALERAEGNVRRQADNLVRTLFATRGTNALLSLMTQTDPKELTEITAAPSDLEVLIRALDALAKSEALKARQPLLSARIRGLRQRQELLEAAGGPLPVSKVAEFLRISRQAVDKRRKAGGLLAVDIGRRGYMYPAWQLDDERVLASIPKVLAKLRRAPAWSKLRFFLTGNLRLGGRTPLEALRDGNLQQVLRAAEAFGEHGAA